jgi:rhomboid protease GluP
MKNNIEIYRFIMPIFLHANFMHLLSNTIGFFTFGSIMEKIMGHTKFLILYIFTGMSGILFSSLLSDDMGVGASTAIFG